MLRALTEELKGAQIEAADGVIGHVEEVYFDDDRWTIRYLVVNTGTWLRARRVLISPFALDGFHWETRTFSARLTRQQVEDSPPIDLAKPVSRQQEYRFNDHYGWPAYWEGRGLWGRGSVAALMPEQPAMAPSEPTRGAADADRHLQSSHEVIGYQLHATDDTLGHVEDLIIDMESWEVRYLAVDTSNWWFGGHVLISPQWIGSVRWPEKVVDLRVTRDVIKHSPKWTRGEPITRKYEHSLLDYYRLCQAWSVD